MRLLKAKEFRPVPKGHNQRGFEKPAVRESGAKHDNCSNGDNCAYFMNEKRDLREKFKPCMRSHLCTPGQSLHEVDLVLELLRKVA